MSDPFRYEAPQIGEHGDPEFQPSQSGVDLDAVFRDMMRLWISNTGRSVDQIAKSMRVEPKEIKAFLRGKTATLDLLTRILSSARISVGDFFAMHEASNTETEHQIATFKRAYLNRLEAQMSDMESQNTFLWYQLCKDNPEFQLCMLTGMKIALSMAQNDHGMDVEHHLRLIEQIWEERQREALAAKS